MDIPGKINNLRMRKYATLILICIIYGCSSLGDSIRRDVKIEKKDGVNAEEAIFIATSYVEKDDYYQKYYSISRPSVKNSVLKENCWAIEFRPNIKGILKAFYSLQVSVDKDTGEIRGAGATK
jgi:hypothetical protein